jgi:hypothetical protein
MWIPEPTSTLSIPSGGYEGSTLWTLSLTVKAPVRSFGWGITVRNDVTPLTSHIHKLPVRIGRL